MSNCITIGLYQGSAKRGDIEGNLLSIRNVLAEATTRSIDLVVFPELYLTGYDLSITDIYRLAISRGDSSRSANPLYKLSQLAYNFQVGIQVGYPERDGNKIYDSCLLFDAYGREINNHRKIHLWDPSNSFENIVFTSGTNTALSNSIFTIRRNQKTIRLGSLICYDVHRSELSKILADKGVRVILFSSAIACNESAMIGQILPCYSSRAVVNNVAVCFANMVGPCVLNNASDPFSGESAVVLSDGSIACSLGQETGLISYHIRI